ncbi:MAG: hypothetical protein ACI9WC_002647, partial [Arenicella sp.]
SWKRALPHLVTPFVRRKYTFIFYGYWVFINFTPYIV